VRSAETWRLYNDDALKVLPSLFDACCDAVITDPPYNVGLDYGETATDSRADYADWCAAWLEQLHRVCEGPIAFTCGIVNLGMWHAIRRPKWVGCWWKPASTSRAPIGFNNWEPILFYGKGYSRDGCDVIRTTEQASLPVNHKKHPIAHPCPKPVEWARKLVTQLTSPGDRVLDPFAGSGTVGLACLLEGRECVMIEQNTVYCDLIRSRLVEAEACRDGRGTGELFAQGRG
jgi:DNA modification methylase